MVPLSDPKLLSRLLYTNPVCFLTTWGPGDQGKDRANVMILSWLTPINNLATFCFSINKRRFSAENIHTCPEFSLSVPTKGMEDLVLAIGKCSGRNRNKFEELSSKGLRLVTFGTREAVRQSKKRPRTPKSTNPFAALNDDSDDEEQGDDATPADPPPPDQFPAEHPYAVGATACHMACRVNSIAEGDPEHWLVMAEITQGSIDERYWNGKQFVPTTAETPPYLTFLGSQKFAYVVAGAEKADTE